MRRSIVFLLIFAVLFGAYYLLKNRPEPVDVNVTPELTSEPIEYIIQPEDGLPSRIHIESKDGEVVEVARNEGNAWVLILPEETAADQGSVEAAAGQVATMRILNHLTNTPSDVVGLDEPEHVINLTFPGNVERTIEIGVLTPTGNGYYVRGENGDIVIVSSYAVDSLLGLLTTPPYAPTEIPTLAAP